MSGRSMVLNYEVDGGDVGGGDFDVPVGGWTEIIPLTGNSLGVNCTDKVIDDETFDFPSASLFDALLGPIPVAHGRLSAAS